MSKNHNKVGEFEGSYLVAALEVIKCGYINCLCISCTSLSHAMAVHASECTVRKMMTGPLFWNLTNMEGREGERTEDRG